MNGFLVVNKPRGVSSYDVIRHLKREVGISDLGHAGTLDPLASGVMLVAVGNYTRLLSFVLLQDKVYRVTLHLGQTSDTYDAEGQIMLTNVPLPSLETIMGCLPSFRGEISQIPPAYSAVHVEGKRAYQLARAGVDVQLPARRVSVTRLEMEAYAPPLLHLTVACSSGTYIRSLGHDLGQMLGCGAVVCELVRTQIGHLSLDMAVDLEQLRHHNIRLHFLSLAQIAKITGLSTYELSDEQLKVMRMGRVVALSEKLPSLAVPQTSVLLIFDEQVVGVGECLSDMAGIQPRKVLAA